MSLKYVSNGIVALLGSLIVVLSMGLSSTTAIGWSAFGIAIIVVAMTGLVQLESKRGIVQRSVDVAVVATGGTLIAASVFFTGGTIMWLAFALALGLAGFGFIGLTLHEIETWRASHQLGQLHWFVPKETERRDVAAPGTPGTRVA